MSVVLCQAQPYSEELPSSVLTNWHSNNANWACTAKPANKGMWCQFNVAQENKTSQLFTLASFHGLSNNIDKYLHQSVKIGT